MARQTREGRRISDALLDELLGDQDPAEVLRDGSLIDDLKKAVAERALDAEMEAHLGGETEHDTGNHRNGHNRKRAGSTSHRRWRAARSRAWWSGRQSSSGLRMR